MSNLIKYNSFVIKEQEKLIIDSNRMVDEILEQQKHINTTSGPEKVADADGFVCGLDAATVEALVGDNDNTEEDTEFVQIDLTEIHRQEEEILSQAREEAENIREQARMQGYEDGINQGQLESEKILAKRMKELEEKYNVRLNELENEYKQLKSEMEPQLVETLLELFTKVTGALAQNKRDMVLTLISGVLRNTEISSEYIIRVSEADYNYLVANKRLICDELAKEVKIDICVEPQFKRNQCVIETDMGVFDSSLDIQLENLIKDIRLLSCLDE